MRFSSSLISSFISSMWHSLPSWACSNIHRCWITGSIKQMSKRSARV
jgi:hypothetical protein